MTQPQYRHELKHTINTQDYYALKQRIKAVAQPDPNAGQDGRYHIRSLYFDNDEDKALREKIYGLPNREKFRLRLYNLDSSLILLEKKSKYNGLCSKQSVAVSARQAADILANDVEWMRESQNALLVEFYSKITCQRLKPRTIVDYTREAYIYPYGNVRLTFDSDIRTGLYTTNLFASALPTMAVGVQGVMLLEVKYDNYLPDIVRDLVQTNTRRSEAFSKYAASRIFG